MTDADTTATRARDEIDALYRSESRRVLATLIRLLGDFDVAEEAMHDAFAAAVVMMADRRCPAQSTRMADFDRALQGDRSLSASGARFDASMALVADRLEAEAPPEFDDDGVTDDRLRLIFTCCHPALSADARIALTLREVCGLQTEEIANAFLVPAPTLAQRIVRAKEKIRSAGIPYQVPERADLPERLDTVLHVIYLVFNEGYAASSGASLTRRDLSNEAIRLARLVMQLLPATETTGLLALMLLHDARRDARSGVDGEIILLEEQDRGRWNQAQIAEGDAMVEQALAVRGDCRRVRHPGGDRRDSRRGTRSGKYHRLGADRGAV